MVTCYPFDALRERSTALCGACVASGPEDPALPEPVRQALGLPRCIESPAYSRRSAPDAGPTAMPMNYCHPWMPCG